MKNLSKLVYIVPNSFFVTFISMTAGCGDQSVGVHYRNHVQEEKNRMVAFYSATTWPQELVETVIATMREGEALTQREIGDRLEEIPGGEKYVAFVRIGESRKDHWGESYLFGLWVGSSEKKRLCVWSCGPDGISQRGGGDDIMVIVQTEE